MVDVFDITRPNLFKLIGVFLICMVSYMYFLHRYKDKPVEKYVKLLPILYVIIIIFLFYTGLLN